MWNIGCNILQFSNNSIIVKEVFTCACSSITRSGVPIYDQIYTQIKSQIISGELEEDAPLPSIRNLAKDLRISVITTKRAYEELERSGFIYTVAGKGCFVADKNIDAVRESVMAEIEKHLEEALKLAGECGLTKEQLKIMIDTLQNV